MSHLFFHRGLCILLLVGIIAANGLAPGVVHRHSGGGRPHAHVASEPSHSHPHPHSHSHGTHHAHEEVLVSAEQCHAHARSEGIEDCIAHSHFDFFGLPLSFPAGGPDDPNAKGVEVVLLHDVGSAENCKTANAQSATLLMADSVVSFDSEIKADIKQPSFHPPHDHSSLLCDTARLERSGVRRI